MTEVSSSPSLSHDLESVNLTVSLPTSSNYSLEHIAEQNGHTDNNNPNADHSEHGSSLFGAIFNFTNSIVGAGAIGLGGAMAVSGGFISIALIVFFGCLTKLSLDMVIRLSVETHGAHGSYENLAQVGLGRTGRLVVMMCKLLYAFGCLVAYIVVIKDNLALALRNLIYGASDHHHPHDWFHELLTQGAWFTWLVSQVLILPLCMLRDMTPLASLSVVSVVAMVAIVGIVIYGYFFCPDIGEPGGTFVQKWIEIRSGILESLGTFVFSFVSQHTVHLVYGSIKPSQRTVSNWKIVSTWSLLSATSISLSVGTFVYMTFWQDTKSDIFEIYPQGRMFDLAKLLLCVTMVLTFPLPFFTCRELLVVTFVHPLCGLEFTNEAAHPTTDADADADDIVESPSSAELTSDLQEPLLDQSNDASSIATELSRRILQTATPKNWLLPEDDRQLRLVGHVALTIKLWFVTTALAIAAPSLGDVLDLVGCASGTIIAFLIPALLSFQIEGYSHLAMLIFLAGAFVGTVGTFFSIRKLMKDL